MEKSLSLSHVSSNYNNYEAARSGFFSLVVEGLKGVAAATKGLKLSENVEEYLTLNVVQASVPHFQLEKLTYRRGNDVVHFAGVPTFTDGEITVDDVVGLDTKSILMAWQNLAYNEETRKGGRMKDYKKVATLVEYDQAFEIVRKWKLHGCWISNITEDAFNKEQDGKRQIRATIIYDRAELLSVPKDSLATTSAATT
jgi:hypothetical protein